MALVLTWVDHRLFRVFPVKAGDLANGLYQFSLTFFGYTECPRFALFAVTPQFDLDEFMIV